MKKLTTILLSVLLPFALFSQTPREMLVRQVGTNTVIGANASVPLQVSTIAALKTTTVTQVANGQTVNVLGYYAAGDGAGGEFTYSSSSTATDNRGTIIAPTTGSGRWLRAYSGPFNVKAFGAKGDGHTVDSGAIAAAQAFVGTTGGTVYFPPGTYVINTPIELVGAVNLVGDNSYVDPALFNLSSIIQLQSGSNCAVIHGPNTGNGRDCRVENLVLDGNKAGQTIAASSIGINLDNTSNDSDTNYFHSLYIWRCLGDGVYNTARENTWDHVKIIGCGGNGYHSSSNSVDVYMLQVDTGHNGLNGMYLDGSKGCYVWLLNSYNNGADGVLMHNVSNCEFHVAEIDYNGTNGVELNADNARYAYRNNFFGLRCFNNSWNADGAGSNFLLSGQGYAIDNCVFGGVFADQENLQPHIPAYEIRDARNVYVSTPGSRLTLDGCLLDSTAGKYSVAAFTPNLFSFVKNKNTIDSNGGAYYPESIQGTRTNNNAVAGDVGEFVTASVVSSSAIALADTTPTNITSISLTPGDWDVWGSMGFVLAPGFAAGRSIGSISTASATLGDETTRVQTTTIDVAGGYYTQNLPTPIVRISIATTTTVYLIGYVTSYGGTGCGGFGTISARRVR